VSGSVPRRRALVLLLAAALATLSPPAPAGAAPDAKTAAEETKTKERVAKVWIEAATALKDKGRKVEAQRALAAAKAADPKAPGIEGLGQAVEALPDVEGEDADAKKRLDAAGAEAAKAWERLAFLPHDGKDDARFAQYLVRAVEAEPTKARLGKAAAAARQMSGNSANALSTGLLLSRLRDLDPDPASAARYDAIEAEAAQSDVALVKHKDHPMVAWLSLPKGFTKRGETPVLVAVEGAGANYLGVARGFASSRGSRKYIVLAPCSLSSTNELKPETFPFYAPALLEEWNGRRIDFDLPGLEAILKVLQTRYGAAKKVAITGFSGGGNLCYSFTMQRPALVWASVPACANFQPGLASGAEPAEGGGPPVWILTGEKDEHREHVFGAKPGIEGQADWAEESFKTLKFTHVKRTMLPGVGHSSCGDKVWSFLDELSSGK
jgi:dienelactone hydrolase